MLYFSFFIAFLTRAHNFAEYINSTTAFLHSKYSNVASVRKKILKVCFLKFIELPRDFLHTNHQLGFCSQKRRQGKVLIILHNIFKLWAEF